MHLMAQLSEQARDILGDLAPYVLAMCVGLVGLVWGSLHSQVAKTELRLDKHDERLVAVERNGAIAAQELGHIRELLTRIEGKVSAQRR